MNGQLLAIALGMLATSAYGQTPKPSDPIGLPRSAPCPADDILCAGANNPPNSGSGSGGGMQQQRRSDTPLGGGGGGGGWGRGIMMDRVRDR